MSGGFVPAVLKIPIQSLVGDNEGLDKIVGHFTNRTMVAGVCRKCKVSLASTGDHSATYPPWKMSAIAKLIDEKT